MAAARPPLQINGISAAADGPAVHLSVPPGEIVGLAGAGHQELAELCDRVAVFYQETMAGEFTRLDEHVLLGAVKTGTVQEAA